MAYDYGYGELGNQFLEVFLYREPDFAAAEDLIAKGADINTVGKDPDENILSEIIRGCCWPEPWDKECEDYDEKYSLYLNSGPTMVKIIRFFLDHGFDVHKLEDRYGAQCLSALALSSFDANIIEATKMLFDAGAKNIRTSFGVDEYNTPLDIIGAEGSYQDTCCYNHHIGNIFEAVYQIYLAVEEGLPYSGIESYEVACGKRIISVFAKKPESGEVFIDSNLPTSQHHNCYNQTLYFVFDGGVLITTRFGDFWVDSALPNTKLIDVSERFPGVVGSTIKRFTFGHNDISKGTMHHGQPITFIEMDSGVKARFTINFGETDDEHRAAYYCLVKD